MPSHDIIDNRSETLIDRMRRILGSTAGAKFAVGYLFLSGLEGIADQLNAIKEVRILIGNTTNRQTLEQLAEGYRRLELVADATEKQTYRRRGEAKQIAADTAENIRTSLEMMDQTDDAAKAIRTLVRMIEERRLKVRIYTKGRMHAKAYIFDYGPIHDAFGKVQDLGERGIAVVGSSNLTLAGVTHPTELNVVVHGNNNHAALTKWFEELWGEAEDFDETLMQEMRQSWAMAEATPYEIYLKTLYQLVKDRLEGPETPEIVVETEIEKKLADFQKRSVMIVSQMIRDYGGAFVADVVGLGKSFIGAAIVKRFAQIEGAKPLIICPASLVEMWERYNEVYDLNAAVVSMGLLGEEQRAAELLDPVSGFYRNRDFVLIDESHNFRNPGTQRYEAVQRFIQAGSRRCCMLTATPRNRSAWDVYHQIKLFHADDKTLIPIDPPDLKQYFKAIEGGGRKLQDLLTHVLYRRRRNDILKFYGHDAGTHEKVNPARFREYLDGKRRAYVIVGGRHQFFPKRQLETIEYSIEETYQGLYQELRGYLGRQQRRQTAQPPKGELTYARYGLWHYVRPEKQQREPYLSLHRAGANLRGLVRVMMFKRFESSVHAFRETARRLLRVHEAFLSALSEEIVPAGGDAQQILYESDQWEEAELMAALAAVSGRYSIADFDADRLRAHISHDIELLRRILKLVEPITADRDAKLQCLKTLLERPQVNNDKRLLFTQYADTAKYLYENLNPGGQRNDIDVVYSGDKAKMSVVARFSPRSNPELRRSMDGPELNTVVATDVLSEGLNLQDCNKIINYDLHWNPVRLIQRFGRIDRIGSDHDIIYGFNFLPETGLDRNLGLRSTLQRRIQEIHETIGEDAQILDRTEQINENAMYAIYEGDSAQLNSFEEDTEDEFVNLTDAEEVLRQVKADDPALYERITRLRDGIRSAKAGSGKGCYVFCEACHPDRPDQKGYQQLFLVTEAGEIRSRDIPRVLGSIKCGPDEKTHAIPANHNELVMRVRRRFSEEVKHREAELQHTMSLTNGQRYVLRELRLLFGSIEDENQKAQINLLERAFRGAVTTSVNRELNGIRRSGQTGARLLESAKRVYQQHNMREWLDRRGTQADMPAVPRVICSEALI